MINTRVKLLTLASMIILSLTVLSVNPVLAADIYVNVTWMDEAGGTPLLINNIMDGNESTLGLNGQVDAGYGDTIHFASGLYQLPHEYGEWFKVKIAGITIDGAGWDVTILRGPSKSSGTIFEILVPNTTISNIGTENSIIGIKIGGENQENFDNTNFSFIKSIEHKQHYAWENQDDLNVTLKPTIWVENVYLIRGQTGFHFIEANGASMKTKYVGGLHGTAQDLTGIVVDAPLAMNDSGQPEFKGNSDWEAWNIEGGTPFREDLYRGMHSPRGFVEWGIDVDSLQDRGIGVFNIEADPMLDENGRPLPGSPAIGRQYPGGYAGAVPPHFTNIRVTQKLPVLSAREIGGLIIPFLN